MVVEKSETLFLLKYYSHSFYYFRLNQLNSTIVFNTPPKRPTANQPNLRALSTSIIH